MRQRRPMTTSRLTRHIARCPRALTGRAQLTALKNSPAWDGHCRQARASPSTHQLPRGERY